MQCESDLIDGWMAAGVCFLLWGEPGHRCGLRVLDGPLLNSRLESIVAFVESPHQGKVGPVGDRRCGVNLAGAAPGERWRG
jgi:hypothetical protein